MSNAGAVQGSAFPQPSDYFLFSLTLFTLRISQYKQQASFFLNLKKIEFAFLDYLIHNNNSLY